MTKIEAIEIFSMQYGDPDTFSGINEPYHFIDQRMWEAMETIGICASCLGSGTAWAECCNGSRGCPCNGTAVPFRCNICHGTGRLSAHKTGNENLLYIQRRAKANNGYLF